MRLMANLSSIPESTTPRPLVDIAKSGPGQGLIDGGGVTKGFWDTMPEQGRLGYWAVRALVELGIFTDEQIMKMEAAHTKIIVPGWISFFDIQTTNFNRIYWSPRVIDRWEAAAFMEQDWPIPADPLALLAHELQHAYDVWAEPRRIRPGEIKLWALENWAISTQNNTMQAMHDWNPDWYDYIWQGYEWKRPFYNAYP